MHIHVHMHKHTHVHAHIHTYIHIHVYVHTHARTHTTEIFWPLYFCYQKYSYPLRNNQCIFFQYQNQSSINSNTGGSTMPGLAPINVYQASPVNSKNQSLPNVLLQLKNTDNGEVAEEVLGPSLLKRSGIKEETGSLTMEMQEFIREFKSRRVHLGYTQDDVGREMSALKGPTYSQSFISRYLYQFI